MANLGPDDDIAEAVRGAGVVPTAPTREALRSTLSSAMAGRPPAPMVRMADVARHRRRPLVVAALLAAAAIVVVSIVIVRDTTTHQVSPADPSIGDAPSTTDGDTASTVAPTSAPDDGSTTVVPVGTPVTSIDAVRGRWLVTSSDGDPWSGPVVPHVDFAAEDALLLGDDGCNSYSARGRIVDGRLQFDETGSSTVGCPESITTARALPGDRPVLSPDGTRLSLLGEDGAVRLGLTRVDQFKPFTELGGSWSAADDPSAIFDFDPDDHMVAVGPCTFAWSLDDDALSIDSPGALSIDSPDDGPCAGVGSVEVPGAGVVRQRLALHRILRLLRTPGDESPLTLFDRASDQYLQLVRAATTPLSTLTTASWAIATYLPDGLTFLRAFDDSPYSRSYSYGDPVSHHGVGVRTNLVDPPPIVPGESVTVSDQTWLVKHWPDNENPGLEVLTFDRIVNGSGITVTTQGFPLTDAPRVLAGIRSGDASGFPRPPLNIGDPSTYTEVASADINGETETLTVTSDGVDYCWTVVGEEGGCLLHLDPGAAIGSLQGSTTTEPDEDGPLDARVFGIVSAAVATIEVHEHDGSVVTGAPQDTHDSFPDNFFLIAIPTSMGVLADVVDYVVGLDASGTEIGRTSFDRPFDLYTHCGINGAMIDGLWWEATPPLVDGNGNPPPGWDNPYQHGTLHPGGPLHPGDRDAAIFYTPGGLSVRLHPTTATSPPIICN